MVVAHPYAGVRGVWVQEGSPVPELPVVQGFKPLPVSPQGYLVAVGGGADLCLVGAEPAPTGRLRVPP